MGGRDKDMFVAEAVAQKKLRDEACQVAGQSRDSGKKAVWDGVTAVWSTASSFFPGSSSSSPSKPSVSSSAPTVTYNSPVMGIDPSGGSLTTGNPNGSVVVTPVK